MLMNSLQKIIEEAIKGQYPEITYSPKVEFPTQPGFGDLTTNAALALAKMAKQSPLNVANELVDRLKSDRFITENFENVTIEGPGFINFHFSQQALWLQAKPYLEKPEFHQDIPGRNYNVIVEFSSPNIAKPFNVGHLRSTIIGDSIARMYSYLGYNVIKDNHIGDWGTQYGKLAYAVEKWGDWHKIEQNPIPELFALYVEFHRKEQEDSQLSEAGREYFKKLEQGDTKVVETWKKLVELSMRDFNQLYKQLGVEFDIQLGESYYEPMLAGIIDECVKSGIAKESNGALLIFFDEDKELKEAPLMIRKSNGTSTYGTRDLAGIKYRFKEYNLDKLILEVGNEQQLYFKQVIRASEAMGWIKPGQVVHVGHGLFMLPTGKMSTRKGETVWIGDLINELKDKARAILTDRQDLDSQDVESIVHDVAIGALKYNDLSQNRSGNVIFDKEKSLSIEGNSAPYLQYVVARSNSVLKKSEIDVNDQAEVADLWQSTLNRSDKLTDSERDLLTHLIRFDAIVLDAANTYLPSTLANYLFQVSQKYNKFYQSNPILTSDSPIKESRLVLVRLTQLILAKGLFLLGIKTPEKM